MSTIHDDVETVKARLWAAMTEEQRARCRYILSDDIAFGRLSLTVSVAAAYDALEQASQFLWKFCDVPGSPSCASCTELLEIAGEPPHHPPPKLRIIRDSGPAS